jgi:acylphosphatase
MKGCRCIVSGRVQGVYYRRSAQRVAESLGVTGSARNLPDGRVEVVAWGGDAALARLVEWLHEGPALARVESVDVVPIALASNERVPDQFTTG